MAFLQPFLNSSSFLEPVTHLLRTCLETCTFPEDWKLHKIILIHTKKKGDQSDVKKTTCLFHFLVFQLKYLMLLFAKRLSIISPLISRQQFWFMKNRSCLSQLLASLSAMYHSVDCKTYTDVMYFDFKKVFVTVPHNELLMKL